MAQYRYSASTESHSGLSVIDVSSLTTGYEIWLREVGNVKRPRSFPHAFTAKTLELLQATWRPTSTFPTFESFWDSLIPDVVSQAQHAKQEPDRHATSCRARYRAIIDALQDDLFLLCAAAANTYKDSPLLDPAMRRMQAVYDRAEAELNDKLASLCTASHDRHEADPDATLTFATLTNPLDDKPARSAADVARIVNSLPSAATAAPSAPVSVRDQLRAEARTILPHLYLTLMPTLDRGARLKAITSKGTQLYGQNAAHRLNTLRLQKACDGYNPVVEADGYHKIPDSALRAAVRSVALKGYDDDAIPLYEALIERDSDGNWRPARDCIDALSTLETDHLGQIVVPWQAYAVSTKTKPIPADNKAPHDNSQCSNKDTSAREGQPLKPKAHKVEGQDPFKQFKDKEHFYIPKSFNRWCDRHGWNSKHTTKDCGANQRDGAVGEVQTTSIPIQTTVTVAGTVQLPAKLDTGADVCVISEHLAPKIPGNIQWRESDLRLFAADDRVISAGKIATMSITLPGMDGKTVTLDWDVHMITGTSDRMLIGKDLLRHIGYVLNDRLLILPSEKPDDKDDLEEHNMIDADVFEAASTSDSKHSLAVTIPDDHGTEFANKVRSIVEEFDEVFDPALPPEGSKLQPHKIELTRDFHLKCRPRQLVGEAGSAALSEIEKMKKLGIIRDSQSEHASRHTMATKKNGEPRFCVAFNDLNDATKDDAFPLPDLRDLPHEAGGCSYFASLDLRSGYWQQLMEPASIPLTSFVVPGHQFEFLRVPFGLKNAPSKFQRAMEAVLDGIPGHRVYVDDIFLYARTEEGFLNTLRLTLQRAKDNRLRLRADKCTIGAAEVEVCGFIINSSGRSVSPGRVAALKELPAPTTVTELRRTMGKFNHLANYLPQLSSATAPLNALLKGSPKKLDKLPWTEEHDKAFAALKELCTDNKALALPNLTCKWTLETDASTIAAGGVLWQHEGDTKKPLAYFSKTFTETQCDLVEVKGFKTNCL
ncbi:hypothetical protein J8273_8473 [Carpediemonas membranifera]|uniref:Reverse transcriptase domain-containing protein n=1 Tax=Carpediemonas membranifera TaxID=201153 RepID=A0A8J6AQV5_9EUKA|nr:hypothetical protein J8273_8473 [Carpediemonas membranifera]|eukprot:KAG9389795.1 hypothetical protein J8273_8473 [Carpediemonas membranifera]